ncbi:MAG: YbhB/YbcL family Raf kinase inhibitor-like protein [Methylophilus sp.]|uniref:YbhB/YbcL family Raf kinase inhibitor-like protein n=1 Tax=Methylophilus sp. TaxID=29541 RepID=UPI003FA06BE5
MLLLSRPSNTVAFNQLGIAFYLSLLCAPTIHAADANVSAKVNVSLQSHIVQPTELPPPAISDLKVPPGFAVTKVAENLGNTRVLAISPQGDLYVTRREQGDVLMLKKRGDTFAKPVRVASRSGMHGIAFRGDTVYMVTVKEVFTAPVLPDGNFGPLKMIIADLPDAGQHHDRTIAIGPDDMLYISVGSTCNECIETNIENATMLRSTLDGKKRVIFASGLRNTIGFDWSPQTGELWGMDHGIDWLGDDVTPEEVNKIEQGKRYGWPYFFGNNVENPRLIPSGKLEKSEWKKTSVPMTLGYTGHAAPMQMAFYNAGQFPAEYRNDAFVAMHGSWNRQTPSGYEIVRIHFEGGKAVAIAPFLTGFVSPKGQSGRPFGLAIDKQGNLLFSDDVNGAIYQVSYKGDGNTASGPPVLVPATSMKQQAAQGSGVPIASLRSETEIKGKQASSLKVSSTAFANGEKIPDMHSSYDQDASFELQWSKGPAATQSYAIIMEDPDAKPITPVVHWVAWNIGKNITSLREGLQKQDRLEDKADGMAGLMQGQATTGKIGYVGPRTPAGDSWHHYHVQVFALDTVLQIPPGANRDTVLKAMAGHVVAKGELVGRFQRPEKPARP